MAIQIDPKIIEKRWERKKEDIHELSHNIDKLKSHIAQDLKSENEKETLTALAVLIMTKTAERVGNDDSAENGHFGVTGFKKKHVKINGNEVVLTYTGKKGVDQKKKLTDERIAKGLREAIKNSPSKYVFQTSDGFKIKNDRIGRYLEDYNITPKAIRGYEGNRFLISSLNRYEISKEEKERKRLFNILAKRTAEHLGHEASTFKKHYMLPELPVYYIQKGKIVDMKNLGYYKLGGEIQKKAEKETKKVEHILNRTFTFKQLFI